jgi:hypothetical protein
VAGRIYQYLYKPAVPTSPVAPVASGGR